MFHTFLLFEGWWFCQCCSSRPLRQTNARDPSLVTTLFTPLSLPLTCNFERDATRILGRDPKLMFVWHEWMWQQESPPFRRQRYHSYNPSSSWSPSCSSSSVCPCYVLEYFNAFSSLSKSALVFLWHPLESCWLRLLSRECERST